MNIVIVLNYNDSKTVEEFTNSIKKYKCIDKIIIVDNCSTDGSYKELAKFQSEKIDVVKTPRNGGYAYGNNYGVKYAKSKYNFDKIIISNPDVYIKEEDVILILDALDNGYDMASGVMNNLQYDGELKVASNFAWNIPTYRDILFECPYLLYYIRKHFFNLKCYCKYNKNKELIKCEAIPGSFFVIKSEAFSEIGGFDEDTFLFYEETILGYKLKQKNKRACIVTKSNYIHKGSITINKKFSKEISKARIAANSCKIYLKKYLGCSNFKCWVFEKLYFFGVYERNIIFKLVGLRK